MSNYYNRQWRLPNAWNGTESNVNKQSNYSLLFDGSSQYIDIDSSSFGSDSFSISLWFKQDTGTGFQGLFAGSGYDGGTGLIIYTYLNTVKIYTAVSGSTTNILTSTTFSFDTWYHVILKREYNVGWSLYIDGTEVNTYSSLTTTDLTSANTRIGKHYTSGLYFNGQIDGVAIFDYALSSSQVTTLYGSSSTGIGNPMSLSPKPVFYAPLGDQDSFNGSNYLVPNSSLKDYVFDFIPNDYISLNNGISLNSSGYSLSIWFNSNSFSAIQVLFTNATSNIKFVSINNSTTIRVRDGVNQREYTVPTLNTGVWYNLIIVVDNGNCQVYLNSNVSSSSAQTVNQNWSIDAINGYSNFHGGSFNFNGELSNAQIFNTALPATGSNSVETLYNNGSPLTSMSGFTSLQGSWKLDASATYDSSTTTWTIPDDSTNSNDGTSSGMTQANLVQSDLSFTSGYSPYALDFDGTNDYIAVGASTDFNFGTEDFTISTWVNIDAFGSYPYLFDFRSSSTDTSNVITAYIESSNRITIYGGGATITTSATQLLVGVWYNIIVKRNSSSVTIHLNGNSADATGTFTNDMNTTPKLNIGARADGVNGLNGKFSNFSIWNTSLTSAQVTEIYNEGVPSNLNNHSAYSNLVSWWQLGSNSSFNTNWTVLDEKGSNNGTSVNMTEVDIVDGVGSYANGLSSGMGGDEVIGDAPYSSSNSLSVNMDVEDRTTDTPS